MKAYKNGLSITESLIFCHVASSAFSIMIHASFFTITEILTEIYYFLLSQSIIAKNKAYVFG